LRFVDASVFVHAFLKPKRKLKPNEVEIKEGCEGDCEENKRGRGSWSNCGTASRDREYTGEVQPLEKAQQVERFLLYAPNVKVYGVEENICLKALDVAEEKEIGLSDAIAYVVMLQHNVREIYSFDRDFDKLEGIVRVR